MSHKLFVGWRVLVLAGLSFTTVPIWAELRPFLQEKGRISISVDAIGTNASSGLVGSLKWQRLEPYRNFISDFNSFSIINFLIELER